jgi:hypothetical protein
MAQDRARSWSAALEADVRDPTVLARLLLAAALRRNPGGTVLWSSRSVAHIQANARLASDPLDPGQLDALDVLLAEVPRGTLQDDG